MGDTTISAAPGVGQASPHVQKVAIAQSHPSIATEHQAVPGQTANPSLSLQPQQNISPSQHAFTSQLDVAAPPSVERSGPYNMVPMASALPQDGYRHGHYSPAGQHRVNLSASASMIHHMSPYAGPAPMPISGHTYYPQQQHMNQYYNTTQHPSTHSLVAGPPRSTMGYYQAVTNHPQPGYYYPHAPQYPSSVQPVVPAIHGQYVVRSPTTADRRPPIQVSDGFSMKIHARKLGQDGNEDNQNTVRGPPRKPRKSGHAIWIGNLPPQADLMSLVHHVCKEASGLESLFLISKSNCAFANFKDEAACVAAQQQLHDSRFQSVRLVSRLRKSTVEGASGIAAPTGPAAATPVSISSSPPSSDQLQDTIPPAEDPLSPVDGHPGLPKSITTSEGSSKKDRFFILKSLTVEDLDLSCRTGIWATQSHNEEALSKAFKTSDNVFLVFSANKSGEYFGYGRMVSEINEDPAAAIEFAPKAQATNEYDLPKAISTDATEYAPKGRIIDDSTRGTIFWEAERDDSDSGSDNESEAGSNHADESQTWGKPFKLEWLSTTRLPFYRTRGLRNPWNSNREVKIARDGTELEPSVGRRLIGLFNRLQSPPPSAHPGLRSPIGMAPGYPNMRPYGH
ncbi:hypothetical protein S40285_00873 [Stachybotrys chlorohalonatus IBT 40285]|uniref:YTH domain-containing protein n=1 Tax=Stachybotrys chlorohalonatus (strain IBT 40285) TaxID=1283841 RepID=A0A084QJQ0_STAC4|nr:hypothetical protein S40285_00873 [Stachybotrys chlorohalonata IBT 40285]